MGGVLEGFAVIGVIIGLGFLLAWRGAADRDTQLALSKMSFLVGSPALMVRVIEDSDLSVVLSGQLLAHLFAIIIVGLAAFTVARLVIGFDASAAVIGVLLSVNANAVNLGLPIAVFALKDASAAVPMLLIQLIVLQPVSIIIMESLRSDRQRPLLVTAVNSFLHPMVISVAVGLFVNVTKTTLPVAISQTLDLIGGLAIPGMLLAFGMSLWLEPLARGRRAWSASGYFTLSKVLLMPILAGLAGALVLGLDGQELLAVVVIAALPTAQNVYLQAQHFKSAVIPARDTILVTTLVSFPCIVVATVLLA